MNTSTHGAPLNICQGLQDHEGAGIGLADDRIHPPDFQPCDDTIKNVAFVAGEAAAGPVDGDASSQLTGDPTADELVVIRHDRDRGVLLDAVDDEVEGAGRRHVGEDRVQRRLHAEQRHRDHEQGDVEHQDEVANLHERTMTADQQRGDFSAVEYRAAADGETDPGAEEESAEDGIEHHVGGDDGKVDEREREGEAGDRQRPAHRKGDAKLTVSNDDEWKVDERQEHRERPASPATAASKCR